MSIADRRTPAAVGDARRPRAFTLIELLVVIGIIGIVVALGVPLFGVLTGSRSQEAGQNLVAAAIGQARTIAVNEGKYAGILFYVDPATDRTAMSVVVIADPASGLEDPDPYDKYKTIVNGQQYRSPFITTNNTVVAGDRVIDLASDASATFKSVVTAATNNNVYDGATPSPVYSRLSLYVPNYKPTVRVYRGRMTPSNTATGAGRTVDVTNPTERPVRNGPYFQNNVAGVGSNAPSLQYRRIQPIGTPANPNYTSVDATEAPFTNTYWGPDKLQQLAPYTSAGEQQLLPIGVGVQLIIQPSARADAPAAFIERYVRTGVIMFDPQGRLTLDPRQLGMTTTTGKYLGLTADAKELLAGVGVVFYDRTVFRANAAFTEADWHYQNIAANAASALNSTQAAFTDNAAQTATTVATTEGAEETWLDANTTPLLINRFSGALSEGQ